MEFITNTQSKIQRGVTNWKTHLPTIFRLGYSYNIQNF